MKLLPLLDRLEQRFLQWKPVRYGLDRPLLCWGMGVLSLAVLPWVLPDYPLRVTAMMALYMVLALGLNIVPGFTGLLDLGFVGFYGIGAYTSGLLILKLGFNFWEVLPLAALNGAFWGILLGVPTLRLTGDYFAIVTFGFSEIVILVITNWVSLTRGPMGLPGIEPPTLFGYRFEGEIPFFYLISGMLLFSILLSIRLAKSRLGRAWFAIREDEIAAECCGIHVMRYKVLAFALSASLGAFGGAFFAVWLTFISPNMFKFWESIFILSMVVLGGMGSIFGVIVGAGVMILLQEVLRPFGPIRYVVFGVLLILMMRYRPEGLFPVGRVRGEMHPESDDVLRHEDQALYDVKESEL
jgi:branched-chain amino acid transport system permease protein